MKLKLILNDGTSKVSTNPTKRQISTFLTWAKEPFIGTAIVQYKKDYVNEFDFDSIEDFKHKVFPCLEKDLVDSFKKI